MFSEILMTQILYRIHFIFQFEFLGFSKYSDEHFTFFICEAFALLGMTSFAIEKIKFKSSQNTGSVSDRKINCEKSFDRKKEEISSKSTIDDVSIDQSNELCQIHKYQSEPDLTENPTVVDLLHYIFCLPKFFHGPIITYECFHQQEKQFFISPLSVLPLKDISQRLCRILLWALFIEFQFHFFYFAALAFYPIYVAKMSLAGIMGLGYWQGQFFMIKYLCMYGLGLEFLRFQGIVPHPWPRCTSLVYSYRDHWKLFDVGLYKFNKKYIFMALGGSQNGLLRSAFSSGVVFYFLYLWHGANPSIFIWCLGNYVCVLIEAFAMIVEKSAFGVQLVRTKYWFFFVLFLYLACTVLNSIKV